jgi:hypothetical protein
LILQDSYTQRLPSAGRALSIQAEWKTVLMKRYRAVSCKASWCAGPKFQAQILIAAAIQRNKITAVDAARQITALGVANQHKNRGGIANQKPVRRMGSRIKRSLLKE